MKFKHLRRLFESKADEQKLIDFAGEELAQKFFKLKNRLEAPENDLYYWIKQGDAQSLANRLQQLLNTPTRKQKDQQASEGAICIYNKDGWKVYYILTYPAAVKYGKNTMWCIAGSKHWNNGENGEDYFNQYTEEGVKFYFYFSPDNEKYALAYVNEDTYQVFDADDTDVTETVDLPEVKGLPNFQFIDDYVYIGQDKLPSKVRTVIVDDDITVLPENAFAYSNIEKITLPQGLEQIDNHAFDHCAFLEEINIPEGIKRIPAFAFQNCEELRSVKLPSTLEVIDIAAFKECFSLEEIDIPASVENIKARAFSFCSSLREVKLHEGLDSISSMAFAGGNRITEITIPASVSFMGDHVFTHNPSLIIRGVEGSYVQKWCQDHGFNFAPLKSNITESINTDDNSMTETNIQIEKSDEGIKSLINDALKYCWGLYNSLTTLRINADAYGYKDIGENAKELEDSQYTTIGTLEGLLQTLDPNAETISDSSEEVVNEIEGVENE